MPVRWEPFFIEVAGGEPWPEITSACGRGLADLLASALPPAGQAEGEAPEATVSGHLWIDGRWQAEITVNGERHADESPFELGHHLLFKLAEFAGRQLGRPLGEPETRAFEDYKTHSPGALLAYLSGRAQRAFELDPGFVAARLALAAEVLRRGGQPAAAAGIVRGLRPHLGARAAELGLALWEGGENEVAADLLQAAVRANPNDAVVMAALAAMLARRSEGEGLDEAQLLATQATQIAADDFRTWAALGDVHRARGDFGQAGFYYGFALRLAPEARPVLKDAAANWLMARQPAQALPLIERAIALDPGDADHHGNLAFARAQRDEHAQAVAAAREAVRLRPGDARLHILHGDLALRAGRREEALDAWARAAELEPGLAINPEGGNVYAHAD